jgi:hypothetical protein
MISTASSHWSWSVARSFWKASCSTRDDDLPEPQLTPAPREEVQGRDPFGDADRVVVAVGQKRYAVADPDPFGAGGHEGEEDLRRRRVAVFVEAVVFDGPDAVVAEVVGQNRLIDAGPEQLGLLGPRRLGELHFVEQRKLHAAPPASQLAKRRAAWPRQPGSSV